MNPTRTLRLATPPERITVAHHSGPGLRLIFWVQGCSVRCTRRCLNPRLLDPAGGHPVRVDELTEALLEKAAGYRDAEGVTVLGGEPFDQAGTLAEALAPVCETGLTLMCYSGHTVEGLRSSPDPGVGALLGLCDLLVDGPFVGELYDPSLIWRGSKNQRILRISERYSEQRLAAAMACQGRALWTSQGPRGDVVVSGAQAPKVAGGMRRLASSLAGVER